ncbi:MAG: nuclear transport factor 2 family protein [Chloroflexi bacterium]|nr:MAG: nuclear transport factor 2 family protein [Chloroflexota bacterium]
MPVDRTSADLIRETEHQRLRALVAAEIELANSLHSDDYQLITPNGQTISKHDYIGGIASGDLFFSMQKPAYDIAVRLFGSAAAVRYQARIEIRFSDQRDSGVFWHTDIYEKRDGRWQAVWSQATRISTRAE